MGNVGKIHLFYWVFEVFVSFSNFEFAEGGEQWTKGELWLMGHITN